MSKTVFVTGADGLLGSNVVRELLLRGYRVKALIEPLRRSTTLNGLDIELCSGNILDSNSLNAEIKNCDYVIHCAASTSIWPNRNPNVVKVNVDGTKHVMEAAIKHNCERFIYIGTSNSFSPGTITNPGTETNVYTSSKYGLDYFDSKYLAQQLVIRASQEGHINTIVMNPTFMIGPYDSGPSSGKMILAIAKNSIPGYSTGGRNYINVMDAAVAVCNGLTMGRTGECYILGCHNLNYKNAFQIIAKTIDRPFKLRKIPNWMALSYGAMHGTLSKLTGKAPIVSYTMAKISCNEFYFDSSKAVHELKLPQRDLDIGIMEAYEWFKENNYL